MMIRIKKLLSVLLIFMLVFSSTVTAFADEDAEAAAKEDQKKQEEQQKAKEEAEKKAAEEKAKKEAEEKAKAEAERKAAEEKAKEEAEKKAAEEKVKEEAEKKAAEEKAEDKADQKNEAEAEEPEAEQEEQPADEDSEEEALIESSQKEDAPANEKKRSMKLQGELSDGTYKPDSFEFSGGTGKAKVTCEKVIIKNGKATAEFTASSDNMTHFYMGTVSSDSEDTSLYDPSTGACGKDVYTITKNKAYVEVELNEEKPFAGRTVAMTEPHWVQYQYKVNLSDTAEKISDDTTIPDPDDPSGEDPGTDDSGEDPSDDPGKDDTEDDDDSKDTTKLKDGTYKVKATTDRKMFYLYPKEKNPATVILVKKNGKMTATITLTGTGYDYVYMGTPKQAKKAGKKNWIKYKKVDGYYTFKIPVSKLDKKLPITPHSSKYESDGDPSTDPWRPDKWIKFYSKGAKKVKDGSKIKTKGKAESRNSGNNNNKETSKDDSNAGTSAVNNSTGLKDGTYKADRFSWSGGSGRLKYIRCTKITVKGGKAYATIEFGSSKYDKLRANGRVYSRQGGGNSQFTIPVKLNANNTIVGRTTAMSQPHWVKYSIFIYKKGADAKNGGNTAEGDDGHLTSTKKLSSEAPDLMGLEFKEEVKVEYAEYFKIYKYEQGVTLIEIDQASDTALYKEEKKEDKKSDEDAEGGEGSSEEEGSDAEGHVEYDEDGNIIAQSQNEIVEGLYENNVVNYIVVPEGVEIPAGLDKDGIILQQPIDKSFVASEKAAEVMEQLGLLDKVKAVGFDAEEAGSDALKKALDAESMVLAGDTEKPDYQTLVRQKVNMGIFPSAVLPEKLGKDATEEDQAEVDELTENIGVLRRRFAALGVPMMIDRSDDEKTNYASAEWVKVYGAVFGKDEEAAKIFDEFIADNKKENNEQ